MIVYSAAAAAAKGRRARGRGQVHRLCGADGCRSGGRDGEREAGPASGRRLGGVRRPPKEGGTGLGWRARAQGGRSRARGGGSRPPAEAFVCCCSWRRRRSRRGLARRSVLDHRERRGRPVEVERLERRRGDDAARLDLAVVLAPREARDARDRAREAVGIVALILEPLGRGGEVVRLADRAARRARDEAARAAARVCAARGRAGGVNFSGVVTGS